MAVRSRANQPCVETVFVGTLVPEIKMGRTYLRPITGTSEGPQKNAFNAPRLGRTSSAVFCAKFPRFRDGQQPKLREMILIKFWFWSFYFFRFGFGQT